MIVKEQVRKLVDGLIDRSRGQPELAEIVNELDRRAEAAGMSLTDFLIAVLGGHPAFWPHEEE